MVAQKVTSGELLEKVREIFCDVTGLDADEVEEDSELDELGVDTILAKELARKLSGFSGRTVESSRILESENFISVVHYIQSILDVGNETTSGNDKETPSRKQAKDPRSAATNDTLAASVIQEAFSSTKQITDELIVDGHMGNYCGEVMPRSTELCIAYLVEAFEQLGCSIRSAKPGDKLKRVPYLPKYDKFMELFYELLREQALIEMDGSEIVRASQNCPAKPATELLEDLLQDEPSHAPEFNLVQVTGPSLADCLSGKQDGIALIFGTAQGRQRVSDLYALSPINRVWIHQLAYFLEQLVKRVPQNGQPLRIMELGAGTGGTTSTVIPVLARLGVPIFKVVDVESQPNPELLRSQHIILSTACIHATRSLPVSLKNIYSMLRPDGFVMLLEQTQQIPWVDFVFGLLEGWWLFEDGRHHALAPVTHWEKIMKQVGFGHVDWTAGERPEAGLQRLIIGYAS
ncbi:methyltransferase domain-containing protein [Trichoderma breve]|uniref:Methyltransferase domain-containing protein n=1 Tax=Trichoderma breve TaxID=2034170 RepID=A0A9W9BAX1_9HYPO|nr:methyltransferase domain-containing protein [Trichoderma breve]KAJ4857964.1 methyltransferase domain-containing protein [Trichoderma breve]